MIYYKVINKTKSGDTMLKLGRDLYHQYKLIFNSVFLVSLTSVLFVYPFDSHFRFTLGVAVLSTSLLYFPQISIIPTALFSGLGIFITRLAIDIFTSGSDVMTAAIQSLPAFCYYALFGICFYALRIRSNINNVLAVIFKLSVSDFFSNMLEIFIRHDFRISDSVVILPELMGVAFFRAILVVYGYYLLKRYRIFILAEEHLIRYTQLIIVFAKLKAELYYLQKSSQDIENVMERSYLLYHQLNACQPDVILEDSAGGQALIIARDIHEIKKDYYRVISGIEDLLVPSTEEQGMRLSEIFYIIEQNTIRFLRARNKKINITFHRDNDFTTGKHYAIVSILNNLIVNAIEACDSHGFIKVTQSRVEDNIVLCVEDDGKGIAARDFALIFNPGYSTKYSETTGKMSTGLGLAHVKNLTEMLGGVIDVASQLGVATMITIAFPYTNLTDSKLNKNSKSGESPEIKK